MELVKDFPVHRLNPFLAETSGYLKVKERFKRVQGRPDDYVSLDTGEEVRIYDVEKGVSLIDNQPFLKSFIYHSTSFLEEFCDMPKCAQKVMVYVIRQMERDKDVVLFSISSCQAYAGYPNRQHVRKGLVWLLKNKFLARTSDETRYFVNPTKVFNGNRVRLVKPIQEIFPTKLNVSCTEKL